MWAIYWRILSATVLIFAFVAFLNQEFKLLTLAADTKNHPTLFWGFMALCFLALTLFQRKGLVYLFWGSKLAYSDNLWQKINFSIIAFYSGLALLSSLISVIAIAELWALYKLYCQPLAMLFFPLVIAKFLLYRNE